MLTPCFLRICKFLKNELVKWTYKGHFRLTNETLNLNNFFIHNLALKICPYCFLITTHHTGLKKINLNFNFVDKIVAEIIFKWSSLLLSILMIPSFCSSAKQKWGTSCTIIVGTESWFFCQKVLNYTLEITNKSRKENFKWNLRKLW